MDFKNVMTSSRSKPPFGIANMGKSFRNEITPGNFIFRTREFEQMEMEFFVAPGTDEEWHQYWIDARTVVHRLGVKPENLRHYEHRRRSWPTIRSVPSTSNTSSASRVPIGASLKASPTVLTSIFPRMPSIPARI